jgi:hypothetical protein
MALRSPTPPENTTAHRGLLTPRGPRSDAAPSDRWVAYDPSVLPGRPHPHRLPPQAFRGIAEAAQNYPPCQRCVKWNVGM